MPSLAAAPRTVPASATAAHIGFLVEAFGFEETAVYAEGDQVHHAELAWPLGGGIMLGSVRPAGTPDAWPVPAGQSGAYVVTDDPDALFASGEAWGITVVRQRAA